MKPRQSETLGGVHIFTVVHCDIVELTSAQFGRNVIAHIFDDRPIRSIVSLFLLAAPRYYKCAATVGASCDCLSSTAVAALSAVLRLCWDPAREAIVLYLGRNDGCPICLVYANDFMQDTRESGA